MSKQNLELLLKTAKHVHFVGIGGISMSALAEILLSKGINVSGSDITKNELTENLKNLGIKVYLGHDKKNIKGADIVIYTAAVKLENPEICAAIESGLAIFERAILLGVIMKDYSYSIAVSGTHGKTTATSMISQILLEANKNPTCLIGGRLSSIGGNIKIGSFDYLVTEACEYVDSFLSMSPNIAVVLNIEEDHMDYFKDLNQIKDSFKKFINLTGTHGLCVICGDDKNTSDVAMDVTPHVLRYGISGDNLDILAKNITKGKNGCPQFDIYYKNELYCSVNLSIPGRHNILNSLAAFGVCVNIAIDPQSYKTAIENFCGTKRRFEYIGQFNNAALIDDYAHHPTEIKATLTAVKSMNFKKIYCIFQPHTYSRTKAFFDDFAKALSLADQAVLVDIYAAREKNTYGVSSQQLSEKIQNSLYFDNFEDAANYIKSVAKNGDLVITMGAGNIYEIHPLILNS